MPRTVACMIALGIAFCAALSPAGADVPAFPGAEGFGAATPGGRGGRALKVTNLLDSGPGSFRDACAAKGPRTIVFEVAGYIDLASDITLTEPFCTIAGQTAPGDGVCVRRAGLYIDTHDVVMRHMRFRLGAIDPAKVTHFRDCVHISGKTPPSRIVLDHCSFTWAVSRNLVTWSGAHDITVQYCLIGQPLRRTENDGVKYGGMGFLIGDHTKNITMHHCLLAHQYQRNPRLKHGVAADLVNNVVYNWTGIAMLVGDFARDPQAATVEANVVNCWLQAGPNTTDEGAIIRGLTSGRLFISGNITNERWYEADLAAAARNVTLVPHKWPQAAVTVHPADEAYRLVLDGAGAIRPRRDAADERIVESVRTSIGLYVGSEEEAGGWPELKSGPPAPDRDGDGLPDAWETAAGLDPADPSDAAKDRDHDGYTNLEEWLNAAAAGNRTPATRPRGG